MLKFFINLTADEHDGVACEFTTSFFALSIHAKQFAFWLNVVNEDNEHSWQRKTLSRTRMSFCVFILFLCFLSSLSLLFHSLVGLFFGLGNAWCSVCKSTIIGSAEKSSLSAITFFFIFSLDRKEEKKVNCDDVLNCTEFVNFRRLWSWINLHGLAFWLLFLIFVLTF